MFTGKTQYKISCSRAISNYQRVCRSELLVPGNTQPHADAMSNTPDLQLDSPVQLLGGLLREAIGSVLGCCCRNWAIGSPMTGGWYSIPTPLKNMSSPIGMMKFLIDGKHNPCSKPPTRWILKNIDKVIENLGLGPRDDSMILLIGSETRESLKQTCQWKNNLTNHNQR